MIYCSWIVYNSNEKNYTIQIIQLENEKHIWTFLSMQFKLIHYEWKRSKKVGT